MIEFEIRHTTEELRRVYTDWWRQRFGRAYSVAFGLAVFAFTGMLVLKSARWWLVGPTTLVVTYAAYLTIVRDNAIRLALKNLDILGADPIHYRLDDVSIREQSANGTSEARWRAFDSVKRRPDALLVFRKPEESQIFVVLPLAQIPPDVEAFIRARLGD